MRSPKSFLTMDNPLRISISARYAQLGSAVFYIAIFLNIVLQTMQYTTLKYYPNYSTVIYPPIAEILLLIHYMILFKIYFMSDFKLGELAVVTALLAVAYVSYRHCRDVNAIRCVECILAAKGVSWKRFAKFALATYAAVVAAVIILHQMGYLANSIVNQRDDLTLRDSGGFIHPNFFGIYLLTLCILWLCVRYDHLKIWDYALCIGVGLVSWFIPQCRTATVLIFTLCLLIWLSRRFGERLLRSKLFQFLLLCVWPALLALSYWCSSVYSEGNTLLVKLNIVLSDRIAMAHTFLTNYGIALWGQKVKIVGNSEALRKGVETLCLDNVYMRLLIQCGLAMTVAFTVVVTWAMWKAIKRGDRAAVAAILVTSFYGLSEIYPTRIVFNIILVTCLMVGGQVTQRRTFSPKGGKHIRT